MASLSSAGIGSGLSVESIISSLMSIEKQPVTKLQSQQTGFQSKISALGTLKSGLLPCRRPPRRSHRQSAKARRQLFPLTRQTLPIQRSAPLPQAARLWRAPTRSK
jgi:hypothetical protein